MSTSSKKPEETKRPWPFTVSPILHDGETSWLLPVSLSFFLRTVVVDSLEKRKDTKEEIARREQVTDKATMGAPILIL